MKYYTDIDTDTGITTAECERLKVLMLVDRHSINDLELLEACLLSKQSHL